MTAFSRLQLCALLQVGLFAAACCLRPEWAGPFGPDSWNPPALAAALAAEQERSAALEEESEAVRRRIDTKHEVAEAVLGGRLDLLHAAARFRDVIPADGRERRILELDYRGSNDDERFCRAVIAWVGGLRGEHPRAEVSRQVARLEAELDERLRRDGSITLPPRPFTEADAGKE
jgi:hypothetical protein